MANIRKQIAAAAAIFQLLVLFNGHSMGENLEEIIQTAEQQLDEKVMEAMKKGAQTKIRQNKVTPLSRAMSRRNKLYREARSILTERGYDGVEAERMAKVSVRQAVGSRISFAGGYGKIGIKAPVMHDLCNDSYVPKCPTDPVMQRFRTINGACNNLGNGRKHWGSMSVDLKRILPGNKNMYKVSNYVEPVSSHAAKCTTKQVIKTALDEVNWFGVKHRDCSCLDRSQCADRRMVELPSSRMASYLAHPDTHDHDHPTLTLMLMQFGQFLDHDMSLTPEEEIENEHCACDSSNDEKACFPVRISPNDKFYSKRRQTCLPFPRSTVFCEDEDKHEQFNDITSYIDASNVYGSTEEQSKELRAFDGLGKLKVDPTGNLLPVIGGARKAGDSRSAEMPGLAVMHTLFIREHNRICDMLRKHPMYMLMWTDELFFQNARRILIAEWQHITYDEYLPNILGPEAIKKHGLSVKGESLYRNDVDASITNSFATAAYRFGHTMIQGFIEMYSRLGDHVKSFHLGDNFFNLKEYEADNGLGMEQILKGLVTQRSGNNDRFFSEEITTKLFREEAHDFGDDLVSRNIQRGRDHGLPSYAAFYHEFTDVSDTMDCWSKGPKAMPKENWDVLKDIYLHPHHIDLFVGGVMESTVQGGVAGPTFTAIKSKQFQALKDGDRFFFTHWGMLSSAELTNIRKRTLADIICENSNIEAVPKDAFHVESSTNPLKSCSSSEVNRLNIADFGFIGGD